MMRWRIERDYQELKQEFGLSHYEGRGRRGFHHHATLCIAAYGFLLTTRLKTHGGRKKLYSITSVSPTQRLHATWPPEECSATFPTRSPPCAFCWSAPSLVHSRAVLAVGPKAQGALYDTVRLSANQVLMHSFVSGELAYGNLRQRDDALSLLRNLPAATIGRDEEVLLFIEHRKLRGHGIGYIDAHLLTAVALSNVRLWTRDKRLRDVASELGMTYASPTQF